MSYQLNHSNQERTTLLEPGPHTESNSPPKVSNMTARVQLNPLLRPEILDWDVSAAYEVQKSRLHRVRETAIIPPTRSMTIMVPGLPFHLRPLYPTCAHANYITVEDVLDWIHFCLKMWRLGDLEYNALLGWQMDAVKAACSARLRIDESLHSDAFFRSSVRGCDLIRGRVFFRGLRRQLDANGANIWILILRKSEAESPSPHFSRILEPGNVSLDYKDAPPSTKGLTPFAITGEQMVIHDISGRPLISVPAMGDDSTQMVSPVSVLKAIHAAMTDKERTFWKDEAESVHRFLGLWHDEYSTDHMYTLLTQPAVRSIPEIHRTLRRGGVKWSVFVNPTRVSTAPWLDQPATSPGRAAMDVRVEFAPGISWSLPVLKAPEAQLITARHLLSSIYQFLVQDTFEISFRKLPLHLQYRIKANARLRKEKTTNKTGPVVQRTGLMPEKKDLNPPKPASDFILSKDEVQRQRRGRDKTPKGFKRVDIFSATILVGMEHQINGLGEDEWRIHLGN
ncbi:hypothetical protein D9619_007621 [Psilocybe cf. subviscida]|uniref:DUF6699 domain-containing protein n=1 Tax=Psilocybe cf. subviscida TaxID=2480587 RepID=A0A8H5ATW1_9AGAR|nr:hypothetical protein D9619_007621 [Psilocybe cf. subviscida]